MLDIMHCMFPQTVKSCFHKREKCVTTIHEYQLRVAPLVYCLHEPFKQKYQIRKAEVDTRNKVRVCYWASDQKHKFCFNNHWLLLNLLTR